MMSIFQWFDANCAWIYNNTNIFTWMFTGVEMGVGGMILKCLLMSVWFMLIIMAPVMIIIRGVGYIIGGWTGMLPAFFVDDDD